MAQYEELIIDSEWYGTNLGLMLYYAGYNRRHGQFCKEVGIAARTLSQMLHNETVRSSAFKKVMQALNCTEPGNIIHNYYKPYRNKPLSLKKAREVRLMTQAELGRAVGKTQSYIANLEANIGALTEGMHISIANALNMDRYGYYMFYLR